MSKLNDQTLELTLGMVAESGMANIAILLEDHIDALQAELKIQDDANEILTRNNAELQAEVDTLLSGAEYTRALKKEDAQEIESLRAEVARLHGLMREAIDWIKADDRLSAIECLEDAKKSPVQTESGVKE